MTRSPASSIVETSLEVRDGPGGVGIRRPARLPVAVRARVRIPAQVTAKAQLQAARGDPVALDDGLCAAVLVSQRAPRRLQQVRGLWLFRGRVPLAVQQLKAGQARPFRQASACRASSRALIPDRTASFANAGVPRARPALRARSASALRPSPESALSPYGHFPGAGGRVRGQLEQVAAEVGAPQTGGSTGRAAGCPGACGREWRGGDFRRRGWRAAMPPWRRHLRRR